MKPWLILTFALLEPAFSLPKNNDGDKLIRPVTPTVPTISDCEYQELLGETGACGTAGQTPLPTTPTTPTRPSRPTSPRPPTEDCRCVEYFLCSDNSSVNKDGHGLIDIRSQECGNYLERCCPEANILPEPSPPTPASTEVPPTSATSDLPPTTTSTSELKCGKRNKNGVDFRIMGAKNEAEYGEFPWMVAVLRQRDPSPSGSPYQCGGSLIHPSVVLTAAHCVKREMDWSVRVGEWDTQTEGERYPNQDRQVSRVILHEQFNSGTANNDIALLILDSPIDLSSPNVGLACLPEPNESMDGRACVANGWGKDQYGKAGQYQSIMKKVDLPIVDQSSCLASLRNSRLGPKYQWQDSFLCAGGVPGKDTCEGDGGSPLVCPSASDPEQYVQAGVVSWGLGCGTRVPGIHASVPRFVDWIRSKLTQQGLDLD